MLIVHELGEDKELLGQELVGEVDGGVHYAGAVRTNRVGDVTNVDRVQVLVIARPFNKNLVNNKQSQQRNINNTCNNKEKTN